MGRLTSPEVSHEYRTCIELWKRKTSSNSIFVNQGGSHDRFGNLIGSEHVEIPRLQGSNTNSCKLDDRLDIDSCGDPTFMDDINIAEIILSFKYHRYEKTGRREHICAPVLWTDPLLTSHTTQLAFPE